MAPHLQPGTLTVTNSTFSGNYQLLLRGRIANFGTLIVTTARSKPIAQVMGRIANFGTLTVTNRTFSSFAKSARGSTTTTSNADGGQQHVPRNHAHTTAAQSSTN